LNDWLQYLNATLLIEPFVCLHKSLRRAASSLLPALCEAMFGWGGKGKGGSDGQPAQASSSSDTKKGNASAGTSSGAQTGLLTTPQPAAAAPETAATQLGAAAGAPPKPSSVFEFGAPLQAGQLFMRGVCAGEDPDAIQACAWSVEPVPAGKQGKDKRHVYRIEF
jgi:hypothetical protein